MLRCRERGASNKKKSPEGLESRTSTVFRPFPLPFFSSGSLPIRGSSGFFVLGEIYPVLVLPPRSPPSDLLFSNLGALVKDSKEIEKDSLGPPRREAEANEKGGW